MSNTENPEPLSNYWRRHIRRWRKTDFSRAAYCRNQNISYHRFVYWLRKLSPGHPGIQHSGRSDFVPVKAEASPSFVQPSVLTATLPNGVHLQGIAADNLDIVKQLIGLQS